jgi:hypothetical protein
VVDLEWVISVLNQFLEEWILLVAVYDFLFDRGLGIGFHLFDEVGSQRPIIFSF